MGQEGLFDLSPSQEIVWVHERLSPGSRAYNFTAFVVVRGDLDVDVVHEALGHVLDHHDGLRLELADTPDARPAQRVRDRCRPRFRSVDISGEPDVDAAFDEVVRAEATTSFDTYEAPLVRWCLVRTGAREHRLIHVEHHLIHDGRSFLILVGDLFRAYRALVAGEPVALPATVSYTEHLRRVAAVPPGDRAESLAFWHRELADATFEATLPGLARPGAVRRNRGAQHRQRFAPEVADRIRARSVASGHTVYTTMLGLFAELVRRHCGQDDLIVGTAVGNRYDAVDTSVGMFVNTIPLRLRLSGQTPVDDMLSDVTETLIRAIPHQDVPIQQLTREIGRHTSGVENPLFNIAFSGVDDSVPDVRVPGLDVVLSEGHNFGTTRFDLDLVFIPDARRVVGPRVGPAALDLHWDYDADLFSAETVRLLADRLAALVEAYLDAPPTAPVASLAATPAPPAADVAGKPAHPVVSGELLSPDRDPEAVAVISGARTLTYRDLDALVRRTATALTAAGVGPGAPVAVLLPRGLDVVVALLACARVGAVYCPMSAADPADRLHLLLERLRPALVLTDATTAGRLPALPAPLAVLDGDRWPAARPAVPLDEVAYVIHTSGSTGVPKPVAVGRAALSHLVDAIVGRYALTPDDRVLMFTQPHFDVALEEILPTLAVGARLVVPQSEVLGAPELVAVSAARRVTVANLPTSYVLTVAPELASAWRDGRWRPRLLVVGGEAVTGESLRELVEAGPTTVLNAYGVTEATVTSTVHEVTGDDLASTATVPLGVDLPGVRTYVVDRSGRPLPDGAVGEIAVGGAGLARGYLHDEAATARSFGEVDALGGQRVYRTGDRGYRDTSGRLRFAGRLDDQVKFRGYRIEPGEIRSVLVEHPGVRDAYVLLAAGADSGEAQLVAYVEPGPDGDAPEPAALRAFLAGRLPEHLVPSAFVPVPKLPRTPVGKVRRDDLPPVVATATRPDVPLASDREEQIARIWREVLGVDRVGRTDNFFDLGGHSLLLLRVHARLVRELRLDLPVVTLFRYPTVEAIAAHLAGGEGEPTGRPDLGPARLAGRDRLSRARARRGGADDPPHEAVPLDERTQP
ncbi:amino acid adenylation domain-containing protein [Micromonospora echinospora]|uniref:non-ribosomal peptide synthetase n=1 Tax=Micromonospora echinospora TaxID=1877 RepID=UPI0036708DAF